MHSADVRMIYTPIKVRENKRKKKGLNDARLSDRRSRIPVHYKSQSQIISLDDVRPNAAEHSRHFGRFYETLSPRI